MNPTLRLLRPLLRHLGLALAWLFAAVMASSAWADPPGRVGRLSETTGQVWLYTPDTGEWIAAPRNRPITSGDRIATDNGARAELRVGTTVVRLDGATEVEILAIEDDRIALHLHAGSAAARLPSEEAAEQFELRTVEGDFHAELPGRYRFDRVDGASHLTVWRGEAVYEGPGSALTVEEGQRAEFWLERGLAQYAITDPVRDRFAAWNGERDRREARGGSSRYVSPEMTGAEDLDRYGRWQEVPAYGTVWIPSYVPAGWAPYRTGHWAWISPWGWTWVDDMPWGFAPFHYGRWAYFNNVWGWVPGAYVARPVYAPALVGWIGGPHVNVTIGAGPVPVVGWFPLAPREVYVPYYPASPSYTRTLNVANATQRLIDRALAGSPQEAVGQLDYANRRHRHALTVVPQDVLVQRRPVAPAAGRLAPAGIVQRLASQPSQSVMLAAPPVAPAVAAGRGERFIPRQPPGTRSSTLPGPATAPSPAAPGSRWQPRTPQPPAVGAAPPRAPSPPTPPAAPMTRWLPPGVQGTPPAEAARPPRVAPAPPPQATSRHAPAPAQPAPPMSRWLPRGAVPAAAAPAPVGEPRAQPAPAQGSREWRGPERGDGPDARRGDHRERQRER